MRILPVVVFILSVLPGSSLAQDTPPAGPSFPVTEWLVVGPVARPLPLFHGEKPGAFGLEELVKAEPYPREAPDPAASTRRSTGNGGMLVLDRPVGTKVPAMAWLAASVTSDRFQTLDLEVTGSEPRRAWLDGEPIALGGFVREGAGSEVKGKVKLTTGTHRLVVLTVANPERDDEWKVGVVFKGPKDSPALTGIAASTGPERDIDLVDVIDLPRVTSAAVSPDGALVAATLTRILPGTDDAESWVEVRSTRDGSLRRTWRGGSIPSQVAWAPKGSSISYVTSEKNAKGDDAGSTLWVASFESGAVEPVVERVAEFTSYQWSPDGTVIAYSVAVKPEPDKRGLKRHENLLDRQADYRTKRHVRLVSWPGRVERRITAGPLSASVAAFSPDGRRLILVRSVEDLGERPYSRQEAWEVDVATSEARKLRDLRWLRDLAWSPDGRQLLVLGGPSAFGKTGWNVPEGLVPNENEGEAYIWDPGSDAVVPITREFDPAISSIHWSRHDGRIYMRAADGDREHLFGYDPATKRFSKIDAGFDVVADCAFADRAPVAACSGSSPWTPQALNAVDLAAGTSRAILKPAERWFANVRRGRVEDFSFKTSNGRTIDGRVYLPPSFDSARAEKYPVIVNYYGGTSPVSRDFGGRYPKEWWAAQGYVVYVLQPSGAYGYGQAFAAMHVNDWGKTTSEEILEGTRAFLAAHPYADPKRVGIIGASYGGFMTMLLVTKTDAYAAAVAHAGISSISSYWGEGYWGYSYSASATAESFPWNRKDVYVDQSPLFHAEKVKTPVLLTHGSADTNVPRGESWSFYTALKLVGAPVELVEVEGLDHLILAHSKRLAWSRTIVAWFDRWLKGQAAWWEDLYPGSAGHSGGAGL